MSQGPIPIDPRLLGAVKRALGRMPAVPYDLTQVKVLDNFYSPVDPYWDNVPEGFVLTPGEFSAIGRMEKLRQLSVVLSSRNQTLDMGDFSWLPRCKNLQHLDLALTNFSDCALLLQLPALKTVRLPEREQLVHLEALKTVCLPKGEQLIPLEDLDALPQSVKVRMDLTPYPSVSETFKTPPPPKPKPEPSEKAKAIVAEVKRRTETPCWKLTLQPEGPCGLLDSKVGGLPYWDPALPYPTDSQGNKMTLLAQLNFAQLGTEAPLPAQGLLQFFIGQDDVFGIDFDQPDSQKDFRVVYHPEPDPALTLEQIQALDLPTHVEADCCTPVFQEAVFTAEKTVGYMGPEDGRFDALFREVVRAVTGEDIGEQNAYQYLGDADCRCLNDQLNNTGHRLLGYPFFTQYDPREPDSPYDTLLFQLDSDMIDRKDLVLWGDCGVGNFFINREDLLRRDFSRILYNWDCS